MIRSHAFFKRTRRGKVLRVVEQHYLRDDLGVGAMHGRTLTAEELAGVVGVRGGSEKLLSVLDTNVALNQLDFLEAQSGILGVVMILQTVLEETKKNSLAAYRRLRKLLQDETKAFVFLANDHHSETFIEKKPEESANDYNDRAIRVATGWLQRQLGSSAKVLLHTFDRANRERAAKEGLSAITLTAFVEARRPELVDLLATPSEETGLYAGAGGGARAEDSPAEHRPMSELTVGIRAGRLFQGVIRVEKHDWRKCYFTAKGLEGEARVQVLIYGAANVNRAVDGDVVAVEILPRSQWLGAAELARREAGEESDDEEEEGEGKIGGEKDEAETGYESVMMEPTAEARVEDVTNVKVVTGPLRPMGRVVGIIKRNWRVYCGVLQASEDRLSGGGGSTAALFVPVDKKIPKVRIQTRQREALSDKRILVGVDSWPINSRYPIGHYVKTLGPVGDKNIETEVLLHEYNIPWEPFSEKVMACLPPSDWAITPENSVGRRDLRHLPVCSIDPPGCKDIDDALHCVALPNGNYHVGVHIADVTYFVEPGSALDEEAANRSTSTYLVQKRLDMLPKLLTETLCSLTGKADHFAFTVLWEMTPDADIVSVDFCKSIIYSQAALSYNEAQLIHDDPNQKDSVAEGIRGLNRLAKKLREKRMQAGALLLASAEVKFVLDSESQDPLDVQMYQLKETHALVEEFMLLANITVGKKVLRHYPTLSVLRRHPAPSRARFDTLIAAASLRGFDIKVDDSRTLQLSLDAAVDPKDPYLNKVIRIMATRCMFPAAYFCSGEVAQEDWHHYGLAAPIYTHFTSPIRRYADVVVHRLLAASIGVAPLPEPLMDKGNLHDLCENMNRRHLAAQMAGRGSTGFHTVLYFKENPATEEGYVLRVFANKVVVLVPRFGIEGMVVLGDLEAKNQLRHDADRQELVGPQGTKVRVLDKVKVHIEVEGQAASREAVKYTLVSPPWGGGSVKEDNKAGGPARKKKRRGGT